MYIPRIEELYRPILEYLSDRIEGTADEITDHLTDYFFFGEERAGGELSDGQTEEFESAAGSARDRLRDASLIIEKEPDIYSISDLGRDVLENIDIIDDDVVGKIPYRPSPTETVVVRLQLTDGSTVEEPVPVPTEKEYYWNEKAESFMDVPQRAEYLHPIKAKDLMRALETDTRLTNMMATGDYLPIDGKLCHAEKGSDGIGIKESDFELCRRGSKVMMPSPSARMLKHGRQGETSGDDGNEDVADSDEGKPEHKQEIYHTFPYTGGGKRVFELIEEILDDFPDDFGEALKRIMNRFGMSAVELAYILGLTPRAITDYWNEGRQPELGNAFRICLALRLPPMLCRELLQLLEKCNINSTSGKMKTYWILVNTAGYLFANEEGFRLTPRETYEKINDLCESKDLSKPFLFKKKQY